VEIEKSELIAHIENLLDNIDAGDPSETAVTLTALGAEVTLNLSDLNYGAVILLDGSTWFKEGEDAWASEGGTISGLELATSIRLGFPRDAIFLYNGEVYK